jgi:hypothetical protein
MPKKVDRIDDALLLANGVWDLDPTLPISPRQVELITDLSVDQLKERRRTRPPKPPRPFRGDDDKPGSAIWYPLGEALDYKRSRLPDGFPAPTRSAQTFAAFLDTAAPDDRWPMARLQSGQLIDFFASLRIADLLDPDAPCEWLSLTDILAQTVQWSSMQNARLDARRLAAELPPPAPPAGSSLCPHCGASHMPGRACRL